MDSLFESVEDGENREERLAELARQVSVCTKCDLALTRTNTVFGTGDPYSPLMLIGEGPGENEDATGLPFVGRAGKLLDDILAAVNLTRQDVYLTNVVKCRAAVQEGGRMKNRQPRTGEIKACNRQGLQDHQRPWQVVRLGRHKGDGYLPPGLRTETTRRGPRPREARRMERHSGSLLRVPEGPRGAGVSPEPS